MAENRAERVGIPAMSNMETASFCSQMAMVLKAGISAVEGLSIMLDDAKTPEEKALLHTANEKLLQTGSLYEALSATGAFPEYMVSMVRIGEQAGKLDEVMESLSDYYEKEASLAQTVKSAVTYPCIMILMMAAVILILLTKVMPVFNQVFQQLGTQMTGISKGILIVGVFLDRHWLLVAGVIAALVLLAFYFMKAKSGKEAFLKFAGKFTGSRMLSDEIAAYRFANGMALTLSSGLTPEECLGLTADLIQDDRFQQKVSACRQRVSEGEDLCGCLLSCGIFSGIYTRMASIASRTGVMDEVMKKIAGQYEEEIDTRIAGILAAVEPTLVVVLSVVVGAILLSVMLPLVSIMSAL